MAPNRHVVRIIRLFSMAETPWRSCNLAFIHNHSPYLLVWLEHLGHRVDEIDRCLIDFSLSVQHSIINANLSISGRSMYQLRLAPTISAYLSIILQSQMQSFLVLYCSPMSYCSRRYFAKREGLIASSRYYSTRAPLTTKDLKMVMVPW